jgi:hypothetical protein
MALTRQQLEAPMREIAKQLNDLLREIHGERTGFLLMTFNFDGPGTMAYISNAQRADMIQAAKEWVARVESGLDTDPTGPKAEA